jgi:hypothetical protein
MKLTPAIVRNLYATLYCCDPFTKWKMPLPDSIRFVISDDSTIMASYLYDSGDDKYEHTITISSARNAFMSTLVSSLAHECIHMSFYRQKGDKWRQHGADFRSRCSAVGKSLGLDHLEL